MNEKQKNKKTHTQTGTDKGVLMDKEEFQKYLKDRERAPFEHLNCTTLQA